MAHCFPCQLHFGMWTPKPFQIILNRQAPSELAFHHGLHSTIRDILKKGALTRSSRRRADILIANEVRVAYELKSNQLRESEIHAAAKQADEYRQQFNVVRMLVVNFVRWMKCID
ncbi:LOW QUALITY PROTEIN: Crinkler (CRN) family protein [Phytophthora palmivora]|uniref:Crinkler (CRN) family protein n=1 Tax=Phytophthora palmivora TaxID=4796 RepID=A0A2P4YGN2_9STRA|nr:LOW QUALITY PROTEIN: Crinkler (CRN) family protein [Phytophthora palmivora]